MLVVDGLTKLYANATDAIAGGIRDATFTLEAGTFFTLLGPSGCGKTTTLRCIAGLEKPDAGVVRLGERVLFDKAGGIAVPMNRRDIGMVFQSYAIWPHMTVFENVAFPLQVSKDVRYDTADVGARVQKALDTVDLGGYGNRPATRLSGGEQQRVALARAIVREPQLLLLDEPLSNLDAHLREEMRIELKRLQRQTGITTVYVTHDQSEALSMSDRIAVIEKGRIVQMDTPEAIYYRPRTAFVAGFVGVTNMVAGTADSPARAGATVAVRLSSGERVLCQAVDDLPAGGGISVSIRPENVRLERRGAGSDAAGGGQSLLHGRVDQASFQGQSRRYDVQVGGWRLMVLADPMTRFAPGDEVTLRLDAANTIALPTNGAAGT
ncbi:MAG: Spermidine/putrescine import ATP-binding protein PotA [Pseudomonadota bacterium]|jgi:iron(III) transport system ATP-binding protein